MVFGLAFGWRWGWNWGCVWVVERNRGVLTVGLGLKLWVWDLLTVGLGFACCGLVFFLFYFIFFWWWVLLTVMLFNGGGVGNGLWSGFVVTVVAGYVVWVGFKFDGHGVGHDGSECGSWL